MYEQVASASRWAIVVNLVCLGVFVSPARAGTFTIDQSHSSLVVQLFRDGVAARLGHDHVVRATRFSGRVVYDAAEPDAASITVDVDTASLAADDPVTRRTFGVRGEPTASDIAEIEKSMKAEEQLDVSRFPHMTFVSNQITPEAPGQYLVAGQLTIRGVTRAVRFPARVRTERNVLRATATLELLQSSFGYTPYRAAWGAIKNKDAVMLHVDLTATRQ